MAAHNDVTSQQVIRHPNYNSYTINNDITLIKLATPAQLGSRVSPVCVAETSDNFPGGMRCMTTGWGLTRYNGKSSPTFLKQIPNNHIYAGLDCNETTRWSFNSGAKTGLIEHDKKVSNVRCVCV